MTITLSIRGEGVSPTLSQNIQMNNMGGRVGTYAISTVDFDSWSNQPVSQAPMKTRKTRGAKEVVHKIFTECALVTQDPFWVDKFNTAAMGKLPSKFTYHDGVITYRKGAKCHTLEVSGNPHEAASACMEFFRSNGGIFSPSDEQHSLELQYARSHAVSTQQLTWADANKKVQECMLSYYVMDMKASMTLKDNEVEQLRQTIRLGISNKYFGKHNIRVESNRIHSIEGLLWNDVTREFYINPELKPNSTRSYTRKKDGPSAIDPSQKDTVPQFAIKWKKYIESLDKKIIHYSRRQKRITINQIPAEPQGRRLQLVTTPKTQTTQTQTTDVITTDTPHNDTLTTDEDDDDYDDDE